MRLISFIGLVVCTLSLSGQNLKCKWIKSETGPVVLDTLLIEPGSVSYDSEIFVQFDPQTKIISVLQIDSALICYRVMLPEVLPILKNRDLSTYDPSSFTGIARNSTNSVVNPTLFDFGSDINKSGFISRGITFGNRQDLFVNSTLNLQMQGKLSDEVSIEAVITDQNIPFQPEGNTQQIRDFDNVFIRLYADKFSLTAGDVVLKNPFDEGYFLKYYKNVQGFQFNYVQQLDKWKSESTLATSAAKGKFASIQLDAIEGSLGPYPLRGPNGERFIVVLANSERVFLDGKLLNRGFDRDYIIDYNLGQITFNPGVLITQFSVLRVDFEYSEQFFARTSTAIGQRLTNDHTTIRLNYYSEKDNNSDGTFGFTPSNDDLEQLRQLGDADGLANIDGIDSVEFSIERILYERRDTLDLDGVIQTVFVYSTNPLSAYYSLSFTEVGFGNGDYVLSETTSNGRIYEWISPQNGIRQGNYDPVRQIPLPIQKQMFTIGMTHKITTFESVTQEVAISNLDRNLYSNLDDQDNQGYAWMSSIGTSGRRLGDYRVSANLSWEYDQSDFSAIDRYRPILFNRDWDYVPDDVNAQDYFVTLSTGLEKDATHKISYSVIHRNRTQAINGWQHRATLNQKYRNVYFKSDHFLLQNQLQSFDSHWVRSSNDLSFRKGRMIPGYTFSLDQNESIVGDSIVSSQMHFISNKVYITNSDSSKMTFYASYENRHDRRPSEGVMRGFTEADNYQFNIQSTMGTHRLEVGGTYRKLRDLQSGQADEWLNTQLGWSGRFLKENISHRLTYQLGNVRELQREFVFIEVGGNQGTHAWRDENEDGIKDLNEFYEAINPDERQYAKFFTPTDEFITAFENRYQHSISARFPVAWRGQGGWKKFLERWRTQISLTTRFKTTSSLLSDRLNPFGVDFESDDLLFALNNRKYNLTYNQLGRGLGWEGNYWSSSRKQLLSAGFELGQSEIYESIFKWRFGSVYTVQLVNSFEYQSNTSDFLENRNTDIEGSGISPQIIWLPNPKLRVKGFYESRTKRNAIAENQAESKIYEVGGHVTWTRAGSGALNLELRTLEINYEGEDNSYTSYQLLEALRPGQNTTWRLNWQQNLGKGMNMSLQYNGRTSEDQAPVHTGTVIVTAYF